MCACWVLRALTLLRLKECVAPSRSESCVSLSVVRGLSFLIIWMCVELVLRGVCVVVCVWRYPVGPEGCVPVLVMKGVCVPASGLRGGCDHAVCPCCFSGERVREARGCVESDGCVS